MDRNTFIGITGSIGCGKSTVSRFWSAHANLPLINVDLLCRELLEIGMPGWAALKSTLGDEFFLADGRVNRPVLRTALFSDAALRKTIDRFMHPLAQKLLLEKTADMEGPILVDVPLLFEAEWEDRFTHTIVVFADRATCCRRIAARDMVPATEAGDAVSAQMDIWEKVMRADHVIDNRYSWLLTRIQVVHLAEMIRNPSKPSW